MRAYLKDPDDLLDYVEKWEDWLDGDTIEDSAWLVPTGLTYEADTFTTIETVLWMSGGTRGEIYLVTNRIWTAAGRIKDRVIQVTVEGP